MTKKEQAEFEKLQQQVRLAKALSWTQPVQPDLPAPTSSNNKMNKGYDYHTYTNRVEPACADWSSNYWGSHEMPKLSASRGSRNLYSTRKLALQALRHEVEKECAARLAAIDKQIEAETK